MKFVSFDDIKADPNVLDGIDVLINVGDGDTAHTGGKVWEDPEISSAVKGFVHRGGGSSDNSTISTGLRVLDPAQANILQNVQLVQLNQISDVLYIDVTHETASLQGVLSDLTGLRSERIETVVFSTERCTSTLSLSDVAALGAGDTPFTLRHSGSTASFIVGGADHTALLR